MDIVDILARRITELDARTPRPPLQEVAIVAEPIFRIPKRLREELGQVELVAADKIAGRSGVLV